VIKQKFAQLNKLSLQPKMQTMMKGVDVKILLQERPEQSRLPEIQATT